MYSLTIKTGVNVTDYGKGSRIKLKSKLSHLPKTKVLPPLDVEYFSPYTHNTGLFHNVLRSVETGDSVYTEVNSRVCFKLQTLAQTKSQYSEELKQR